MDNRSEIRKSAERKLEWLFMNQNSCQDEFSALIDRYFDSLVYRDKGATNEGAALAYLLKNDVVFLNNTNVGTEGKPEYTTVVYVNCNDTFYTATADAETLSFSDGDPGSEIIQLYEMCKEHPTLGPIKFCALKRKVRPLMEIVNRMKKAGIWTEELDRLKHPKSDKRDDQNNKK